MTDIQEADRIFLLSAISEAYYGSQLFDSTMPCQASGLLKTRHNDTVHHVGSSSRGIYQMLILLLRAQAILLLFSLKLEHRRAGCT